MPRRRVGASGLVPVEPEARPNGQLNIPENLADRLTRVEGGLSELEQRDPERGELIVSLFARLEVLERGVPELMERLNAAEKASPGGLASAIMALSQRVEAAEQAFLRYAQDQTVQAEALRRNTRDRALTHAIATLEFIDVESDVGTSMTELAEKYIGWLSAS